MSPLWWKYLNIYYTVGPQALYGQLSFSISLCYDKNIICLQNIYTYTSFLSCPFRLIRSFEVSCMGLCARNRNVDRGYSKSLRTWRNPPARVIYSTLGYTGCNNSSCILTKVVSNFELYDRRRSD